MIRSDSLVGEFLRSGIHRRCVHFQRVTNLDQSASGSQLRGLKAHTTLSSRPRNLLKVEVHPQLVSAHRDAAGGNFLYLILSRLSVLRFDSAFGGDLRVRSRIKVINRLLASRIILIRLDEKGLACLHNRRQLILDTKDIQHVLDLTRNNVLSDIAREFRPRRRQIIRGIHAGGFDLIGRIRRHLDHIGINIGASNRNIRFTRSAASRLGRFTLRGNPRMIGVPRPIPTDSITADLTSAGRATHLNISAVRQRAGSVPELSATIVIPPHAEGTLWPTANIRAIRLQPIQLRDSREFAATSSQTQSESGKLTHSVRTIAPRIRIGRVILVRSAVKRSRCLLTIDLLATRKIKEITLSANTTICELLHRTRNRPRATRGVGRNLSPITARQAQPKAARNVRQNRRRTPALRLRQRNIRLAARLILSPHTPLAGLSDLSNMLLAATRRIPSHTAISISRTIGQANRASSKPRDHTTYSASHKADHRLNAINKALNNALTGVEKPPSGISENILHLAREFLHRINRVVEFLFRIIDKFLKFSNNIRDRIGNLCLNILPNSFNNGLNGLPRRRNTRLNGVKCRGNK